MHGDRHVMTPVGDTMRYVHQYRLREIVQKCEQTGNWKMVHGLKKKVKAVILQCDENKWKASCLMYRSLDIYKNCVTYKRLNIWWKFTAKSAGSFRSVSCVLALLCGTQPNGYGANFGSRVRCQICSQYVIETREHIIFDCDELNDVRVTLLRDLFECMPIGMRNSFSNLNSVGKLEFLLTGLGSDLYIDEWKIIYSNAARFIHNMYRERYCKYKAFEIDV